jgi:homoserine kinase
VRRRVVRVPASSANLGPGFDVLAAALSLFLTVEVVETGEFKVVTDLRLRRDRCNLIVRAFETLHPADDFEFRIASTIPLSGGLGSSAAGVVAGLLAADHMFELDADILAHATGIEGHADNAAASLLGGVVICDGADAHRIDLPDGLEAVLVIPATPVRTSEARQALPPQVPMRDAVHNLAAISKLTLGLATGDGDLIAAGLTDRLHQPYRAHLFPRSAALIERAAEYGALGGTVSGAGPTVLLWCRSDQTGAVVERLRTEVDGWADVLRVPFEPQGAYVTSL